MDDELNDNKKDFLTPESGPGEEAANWKAPAHKEPAPLSGSSVEKNTEPPPSAWRTRQV